MDFRVGGSLIGIFVIGSFVPHSYVNLNIGMTIAIQQAVAYLVHLIVVGVVFSIV